MAVWTDIFDYIKDGTPEEVERLFELRYSPDTGYAIPGPDNRNCVQCAMQIAEWLYFLHCLGFKDLPVHWEAYQNICPFGDSYPPLKELLLTDGSVAVFPIAHMQKSPRMARIYLSRFRNSASSSDMNSVLNGDKYFLPTDACFFCSIRGEEINGNSWQFAAALAGKALNASTDVRQKLAWDWIATGTITRGNQIAPVDLLEEKLKITTRRSWFIPQSPQSPAGNSIHQVSTIREAWDFIRGIPVIDQNITLPSNVDVMHVLMGEAAAPILSSVLQVYPKKVCLYYTKRSEENCTRVKDLLGKCHLSVDVPHELHGETMADFLKFFEEIYAKFSGFQVVNITGGNRYMGFAAMLAANRKGISMIYREQDGKTRSVLQILQPSGETYFNGVMEDFRCPPEEFDRINWDYLFSKERGVFFPEKFWRHN